MGLFKKHLHPLLSRKNRKDNDPNSAFIDAIDDTLRDVEGDIVESKIHSSLKTAKGWSLDEYGSWFGVPRNSGENDSSYRRRIVRYISVPRGTNTAIKWAVRNYLQDPNAGIEIYEPFRDIFFLNRSLLNGDHHLMGYNYRFAVIHINISEPFDESIMGYLKDFIPAGVRAHFNYDPSIPRTTVTDSEVSASIFSMQVGKSNLHAEAFSGLERYIGGRVQLGDDDGVMKSFITNISELNSNEVLTGSFSKDRELYHALGTGRNVTPGLYSRIGELYNVLEGFEESSYKDLTNNSNGTETVKITLNPANEVYQIWNIDQYFHKRYYGSDVRVDRTREGYAELIEGSEYTWISKMEDRGKSYDFQIYNYNSGRWETLERVFGKGSFEKFHARLENPIKYLNENRLLVTRIKANDVLKLELDYMALDYRILRTEEIAREALGVLSGHIYGSVPMPVEK